MAPRVSIIEELDAAILTGPRDRREATLRSITNLFLRDAERLAEDQIMVFDDVIGRLAGLAEDEARRELAERLGSLNNAPIGVVRMLARDRVIEVARPVLTGSPRLDETTLATIVREAGEAHRQAIAERDHVTAAVADLLALLGGARVVRTIAANQGAEFSEDGFAALGDRARIDQVIAECVAMRRDVPTALFQSIVRSAHEDMRARVMRARAETDRLAVISALQDRRPIIAPAAVEAPLRADMVYARMQGQAAHRAIGEDDVRSHAEARRRGEAIAALALATNAPLATIERMIQGGRVDPIVIIGRAHGFSWPTVKALIALLHGAIAQQDFDVVERSFARLSPATATQVFRFWRSGGRGAVA